MSLLKPIWYTARCEPCDTENWVKSAVNLDGYETTAMCCGFFKIKLRATTEALDVEEIPPDANLQSQNAQIAAANALVGIEKFLTRYFE